MKIISVWTKNWLTNQNIAFHFEENTKSASKTARQKAFSGLPSPFVFLAGRQSQGCGQGNRVWQDSDLMISVLWDLYEPEESLCAGKAENSKKLKRDKPRQNRIIGPSVSEDFACDLYQALKQVWPFLNLSVKPPNDVCLRKKKIAGILLESLNQGSKKALIAGLGLNVFSCPKDLKTAGSLTEQVKNVDELKWGSFLSSLFVLWNQRVFVTPISPTHLP